MEMLVSTVVVKSSCTMHVLPQGQNTVSSFISVYFLK